VAILAIVISCNSESQDKSTLNVVEQDSISIWLNKGRSKELNESSRKIYLNKALTAILSETDDSIRSKGLSRLSLGYFRVGDSLNFMKVNKMAIETAQDVGDSLSLGNVYWDRAKFYENGSVMDSAFINYSIAHKICLAFGKEKAAAQMLRSMGVIQNKIGDYAGGENNIIRAIELFKEEDDYKNLHKSYNSLGISAGNLDDYDKALEYYQEALKYLQKFEHSDRSTIQVLNNIGMVYLEKGDIKEAKKLFERVKEFPKAKELDLETYGRSLTNLGIVKTQLADSITRPVEFDEALLIQDSLGDFQGLSKTLFALARYYKDIGDYKSAKERAWHAIEFAKMSSNNDRELAALELLTIVDPDSSAYYSAAYIRIHDSLDLAERKMQNKFARIRFETDEVLAKNETLTRQRTIWLGAAVGFLLIALAIYIIAAQRTRNQKLKFLQEQQETNQEIFNLMMKQNQRLEEGKQFEQKRISEELHDGILGQMNGVRMVLLGLNGKNDPASIKLRSDAIEKLQGIQEEIRNISHALSDASIQKVNNFLTSVTELLTATSDSSGLAYSLDYDKDFDWDNLTGEIKINLYRILQECLQNCVKHAQATEVNVEFSIDNDEIQTTIKDNGRGFDVEKQKSGIGHKNIDSRVSKLNGSWNINSRPGNGSLVIVFIPYKGMRSPLTLSRPVSSKPSQDKKLVG